MENFDMPKASKTAPKNIANGSTILIAEIKRLRKQLKKLEKENKLLAVSVDIIIDHADVFESELVEIQSELEKRVVERNRKLRETEELLKQELGSKHGLLDELHHLREHLHTLSKKKKNLEISLETITEHADLFECQLLEMQKTLEQRVAERTQELAQKNSQLESEVIERRRIEAQLRESKESAEQARWVAEMANKAKSEFLARMSHELRTPLNAIIGYSELLTEEITDSNIQLENNEGLIAIQQAGQTLLDIISDILDISKIEAEKIEFQRCDFMVSELLEKIKMIFMPLLENNQLELIYPNNLGIMYADQVRVQQILQNIVGNAIKFTHNGLITIRASKTSSRPKIIRFEITDTGIGIPEQNLENIFQAFNQVDNSYSRKYGGSGIGLSISKQLCELMGGKITVTSTVNQGSTFVVELPCGLDY